MNQSHLDLNISALIWQKAAIDVLHVIVVGALIKPGSRKRSLFYVLPSLESSQTCSDSQEPSVLLYCVCVCVCVRG